ncbi:MAG: 5-dehydro-4-deoxy-D-glucuronate isomerase [Oscillospiraceae bacterium]|nr:5-dehydro-4-deoxy-D-glucuronate isomerase [Oscillospiraceae bacterium]
MDIRYSANHRDVKRYTTQELRDEFLVTGLYKPDEVTAVYSHVDRMIILGIMPVKEAVSIDKGINVMSSFGTEFFLERREVGFFNLGGPGVCTVDGTDYAMGLRDCIYITKGSKTVMFKSASPDNPAKFYGISAPAHKVCETRLLTIEQAAKSPVGSIETSNKRVINQFIHPAVLETCQLMMGMTIMEPGCIWNTMPAHTHGRRMEIYTYFDIPEGQGVFHFMGQPQETRHLTIQNYDAVISPSWSIHSGCGTASYSFIWAMGGENQTFTDMDTIPMPELR